MTEITLLTGHDDGDLPPRERAKRDALLWGIGFVRRRGNGEIEYLSPTEVMIVRNPQNAKQETLGNMTLIHALRAIANRKTPDGEKITVACAANIARAALEKVGEKI